MKIKRALFLLFLLVSDGLLFAQETEIGEPQNTYFKNHKQGKYPGTVNGVLALKKQNGDTLILDFQGGEALLLIEHDPEEMYDVSYKNFIGFTSSGQTQITYMIYGMSNEFHIYLNGKRHVAGTTDGAADLVITGLQYQYFIEKGTEYVSLYFEKEVLFKKEEDRDQTFTVLPGSTVVFAIRTDNS